MDEICFKRISCFISGFDIYSKNIFPTPIIDVQSLLTTNDADD